MEDNSGSLLDTYSSENSSDQQSFVSPFSFANQQHNEQQRQQQVTQYGKSSQRGSRRGGNRHQPYGDNHVNSSSNNSNDMRGSGSRRTDRSKSSSSMRRFIQRTQVVDVMAQNIQAATAAGVLSSEDVGMDGGGGGPEGEADGLPQLQFDSMRNDQLSSVADRLTMQQEEDEESTYLDDYKYLLNYKDATTVAEAEQELKFQEELQMTNPTYSKATCQNNYCYLCNEGVDVDSIESVQQFTDIHNIIDQYAVTDPSVIVDGLYEYYCKEIMPRTGKVWAKSVIETCIRRHLNKPKVIVSDLLRRNLAICDKAFSKMQTKSGVVNKSMFGIYERAQKMVFLALDKHQKIMEGASQSGGASGGGGKGGSGK